MLQIKCVYVPKMALLVQHVMIRYNRLFN